VFGPAEPETPIRQRLALKLIKTGLGSDPVNARFEARRPALALRGFR
jgi:hypothetical protein